MAMNSNYIKEIRTSMTTNKCAPFKNLSYSGSSQAYYADFLLAAHNTTLVKFTLFSSLCEQRV